MPTTISVSPAIPDKLVVNGVDLVNEDELSPSQHRELQRYIDANAHLLGFLDKEKEQEEELKKKYHADGEPWDIHRSNINGTSLGNSKASEAKGGLDGLCVPSSYGLGKKQQQQQKSSNYSPYDEYDYRPASATQSLSIGIGTPLSISDYYGPLGSGGNKKGGKGVSWSDVVEPDHAINGYGGGGDVTPTTTTMPTRPARSYSPTFLQQHSSIGNTTNNSPYNGRDNVYSSLSTAEAASSDKNPKFASRDYSPTQQSGGGYWTGSASPWPIGTWEHGNWDRSRDRQPKWADFPKTDLPTYSALPKNMDDFNRFQTHEHREEQLRKSQERDESVKFYGYGDHRDSGLELKPKRWQGGEVVTDPNIMKKSLKPRRLFYSPIGDGVVEADGIEMKYPPRDLTPRRYVYHQKFTEQDPGAPGLKVIEKTWHEGGDDDGPQGVTITKYPSGSNIDDNDRGQRGPPRDAEKDNQGPSQIKWPLTDDFDDGRGRKRPNDNDFDDGKKDKGPENGFGPLGKFPLLGDDNGNRPKRGDDDLNVIGKKPPYGPDSGLNDNNGRKTPREGWQIEFISNPRECINIYGTDTITNIFDLEDHTPKTLTTIKETYSPAPPDLPLKLEEEEENNKK